MRRCRSHEGARCKDAGGKQITGLKVRGGRNCFGNSLQFLFFVCVSGCWGLWGFHFLLVRLLVRSVVTVRGSVNFSPIRSRASFFVDNSKSQFNGCRDGESILPFSSSMSSSPRERVKVEVNRDIVSVTILSVVAKIDCSVGFCVCVPPGFFQVFLQDVSFTSMFEGDVCFVG